MSGIIPAWSRWVIGTRQNSTQVNFFNNRNGVGFVSFCIISRQAMLHNVSAIWAELSVLLIDNWQLIIFIRDGANVWLACVFGIRTLRTMKNLASSKIELIMEDLLVKSRYHGRTVVSWIGYWMSLLYTCMSRKHDAKTRSWGYMSFHLVAELAKLCLIQPQVVFECSGEKSFYDPDVSLSNPTIVYMYRL